MPRHTWPMPQDPPWARVWSPMRLHLHSRVDWHGRAALCHGMSHVLDWSHMSHPWITGGGGGVTSVSLSPNLVTSRVVHACAEAEPHRPHGHVSPRVSVASLLLPRVCWSQAGGIGVTCYGGVVVPVVGGDTGNPGVRSPPACGAPRSRALPPLDTALMVAPAGH